MSNSLAKKRRVNLPPPPPTFSPSSSSSSPSPSASASANQPPRPMMTLPQILSILEKRLSALEKNKEVDETMMPTHAGAISDSLKETLDEYESRFDMLAEQINHIKDTLMKLQTFTMEVNKTLFQDKIQVVREQDSHSIHFSSLGEELKEEEEE